MQSSFFLNYILRTNAMYHDNPAACNKFMFFVHLAEMVANSWLSSYRCSFTIHWRYVTQCQMEANTRAKPINLIMNLLCTLVANKFPIPKNCNA